MFVGCVLDCLICQAACDHLRPCNSFLTNSFFSCKDRASERDLQIHQSLRGSTVPTQVQPCWDFNNVVSSPCEPCFVLVPMCFASEAWPRPGLAEFLGSFLAPETGDGVGASLVAFFGGACSLLTGQAACWVASWNASHRVCSKMR